jgi:hypothetical protein
MTEGAEQRSPMTEGAEQRSPMTEGAEQRSPMTEGAEQSQRYDKNISNKPCQCRSTDILGGWYPPGLIVHQQRYRPRDSNKHDK